MLGEREVAETKPFDANTLKFTLAAGRGQDLKRKSALEAVRTSNLQNKQKY